MGTEQQQYLGLFGLLLPHSSLCAYTCDKTGGTIIGLLFFWTVPDTYANGPVPRSIFRVCNNFPPALSQFATKNQTSHHPLTINPFLSHFIFFNCVAGLADRERQAHLQVWPHRGVGHTPGFTHHSAIPPHSQPSGKSRVGGVLF